MSDNPWSREYADAGGAPPQPTPPSTTDSNSRRRHGKHPVTDQVPPGRSGRKRLGVIAGLVVVAALTATVLYLFRGSDDGLDDTIEAAETLASIDPADITTPPTISGTATTVETDDSTGTADETSGETPGPIAPPATSPPLTLPEFEAVVLSAEELAAYDLTAAAAANVRGKLPMRTVYTVNGDLDLIGETAPGDPDLRATAASDPGSGRDALVIEFGTSRNAVVVERPTGRVFATVTADGAPSVQWRVATVEDTVIGTGATSLDEMFDSLVTGPITPTMLATARVTPTDLVVRMSGGAFARLYDVVIPTASLRPVGGLQFADLTDDTIANGVAPPAIRFQVYVTDQPAIALVVSLFELDNQPRLFTQYFDRVPANISIDLPPDELIVQPNN